LWNFFLKIFSNYKEIPKQQHENLRNLQLKGVNLVEQLDLVLQDIIAAFARILFCVCVCKLFK